MRKFKSSAIGMVILVVMLGGACSCLGQDCSSQASIYRLGVVSLEVKKITKNTGQISEGRGTGFIVTPDGFVLTADHLVARDASTDEIQVGGHVGSLYASPSPLRVVDEDKSSDVALLKFLDQSHQYLPVRLGNPWGVQVGASLCSIGFSAPLNADFHATVGSLSSLTGQDKTHDVNNLWTTQLPSNVGESGSPVLQLPDKGVIAIKYGGESPDKSQNVNYLIPINLAGPLITKYAGIYIPRSTANAAPELSPLAVQKVEGDLQTIPVGGWKVFRAKVVDLTGKPVAGAKVAWRTPAGGTLAYVSETDADGFASATNLYTFPAAGDYAQTATIVGQNTPTGFLDVSKVREQGPAASFIFNQK